MFPASLPAPEASPQEILRWAIAEFGTRFAVSTSFQREGMVILDMAARIDPAVRVITLDTGRLPAETYEIIEAVRERYGVRVETVLPAASEIESMVTLHGPNLFYRGVPERKLCCQIRKVRPLERKLEELDAYAVGLRREQSSSRESTDTVEQVGRKFKISPLARWTAAEVEEYATAHQVPQHPLYAQSYTSIGCGPCTRATRPGESERAGRWWWEESADKECGLHFTPEGKIVRSVDILLADVLRHTHA